MLSSSMIPVRILLDSSPCVASMCSTGAEPEIAENMVGIAPLQFIQKKKKCPFVKAPCTHHVSPI